MEEFRGVADFEEYEISNFGCIRRATDGATAKKGKILKTRLNNGYFGVGLRKNGEVKTSSIHRLVALAFIENPENKPCVDHIDGNKQNNAIENLRWCSFAENNQNRKKPIRNTCGYKGVTYDKYAKKYKAAIAINNRGKHLGHFATAEEAHAAYCEAARQHHGEFARTE